MRVNLRALSEAAAFDPKRAILDVVEQQVEHVEVFHNHVLVGTAPDVPIIMKGPNGEDIVFHKSDKSHDEGRFQGKAGLVLKVGPLAFKDDSVAKFGGVAVQPGDWVFFRTSDAFEFFLGDGKEGASVRLIQDIHIKGRVPDPSMIY